MSVDVPGGVESGISIHMPGEGAEGEKGAPRGDLYVELSVQSDPYFERSGPDVHVNANLELAQVRYECYDIPAVYSLHTNLWCPDC